MATMQLPATPFPVGYKMTNCLILWHLEMTIITRGHSWQAERFKTSISVPKATNRNYQFNVHEPAKKCMEVSLNVSLVNLITHLQPSLV